MSRGSLSTCRAAGWMKIDRRTKGVDGRSAVGGECRFGCLAREEAKGGGGRMLEVAEHRVLIALVASWCRKGGCRSRD